MFDDIVGLGEGRFGRALGFCPALPFALNWKRLEGAVGPAAAFDCSVFALLGRGASPDSSDLLFTPAAALLATSPPVVRGVCVGCWLLFAPLESAEGAPIDAINWLNACHGRQYIKNGHRWWESSYTHLRTKMPLLSPEGCRGVGDHSRYQRVGPSKGLECLRVSALLNM